MKRKPRTPARKTELLPTATLLEYEALTLARNSFSVLRRAFMVGDPFTDEALHNHVQQTLKTLADWHPCNGSRVVRLALRGSEDAHKALMLLISERNVRNEPLGYALSTYVDLLDTKGPPAHRRPSGRQRGNYLANFTIIVVIIQLMKQFPRLSLGRGSPQQPSVFGVVAQALIDIGCGRGNAETIKKIWRDYGPPVVPGYDFDPRKR
jgi:hypothetical protein